ncbi:MAG: hypothetical protein JST85_30230 [Acidobacteria bacterium]|nr:hypothetical protein [Acidobacteriota bacterium]
MAILTLSVLLLTSGNRLNLNATAKDSDTTPGFQQDFMPPHIFPEKEVYEMEEGDSLVVTLNTLFPSLSGGCIETVGYEAVAPQPGFVTVTKAFQREFKKTGTEELFTHQMSLLVLSPQPGDAGKYEFQIREKLCPQSEGTILTFKVNVRRMGPPLRIR